jgi:hypothetical protein
MNNQTIIRVGCAVTEITPPVGLPLSGFIARRNQPSTGIGDPLFVKAWALEQAGQVYFLFSFEILGISVGLEGEILAALQAGLGDRFSHERCVLTTTHTHSAPTTTPLVGETGGSREFIQILCERSVQAGRNALERLAPAVLHTASLRLPGLTYNRRAVLASGRVSLAPEPDEPVLARGPLDDRLTLLVWQGEAGPLGAFIHFACHGVALGGQEYSGDIPGQIARHFERQLGVPCLYLQGASGDANPTTVSAGRPELLEWLARFERLTAGFPLPPSGETRERALTPQPGEPFQFLRAEVPLDYQPLPERSATARKLAGLERIARGDIDSPAVQPTLLLLADFLNVKPGQRPDPAWAAFAAGALAEAERNVLAATEASHPPQPCALRVVVWRMGEVALVCVGAEMFAHTGLALRGLNDRLLILPVSYAAPVVGYLPDREAMGMGGYEVDDAWRFYGQPAPFTEDAEERLVEGVRTLIIKSFHRKGDAKGANFR